MTHKTIPDSALPCGVATCGATVETSDLDASESRKRPPILSQDGEHDSLHISTSSIPLGASSNKIFHQTDPDDKIDWWLKVIFTITKFIFLIKTFFSNPLDRNFDLSANRRLSNSQPTDEFYVLGDDSFQSRSRRIHELIQIRIRELESASSSEKTTPLSSEKIFELIHDHTQDSSAIIEKQALIDEICEILTDKRLYRKLLTHRDSDAQRLLDLFQWLLDKAENLPPNFWRILVVATQRLAVAAELLPASYELSNVTVAQYPECSGGFADIYKGNYDGHPVCIKVVRPSNSTMANASVRKLILYEAILWNQLRHPNLLPFYGTYRFNGRIAFVAPWMKNGTVVDYIKHLKRRHMSRVPLVHNVAQGLEFLHNKGIIHGDLNGTNVLVDEQGRACIADLGLSSISDGEILAWTSCSLPASKGGTVRYQAPELFDSECDEIPNNKPSDIYAFGMLAYEIFTGQIPFSHLTNKYTIMLRVSRGERPARPYESNPAWTMSGLTQEIWSLIEVCWNTIPEERPTIEKVVNLLSSVLMNAGEDLRHF